MNNPADDIPQSVRRRVMANDHKVMATYHSVAQSTVDDERGGRYAVEGKQTVMGSSPIAYPQQPSTSPWHHDACPPEPPLGFSVDEMEPVGEPAFATSSSVKADDDVRRVRRRGIKRI